MYTNVEAFYRPGSIPEALRLFQTGNGDARFLAGGTDLINRQDSSIRTLIDLTHLGLSYIRKEADGYRIGATTTLADIETSSIARAIAGGILSKAAALSGPLQTRFMATIGGRMSCDSQFREIATALLALDAEVIRNGALLVEISIPKLPGGAHTGWSFLKMGRTESDVSLVNVAAGIQLGSKGLCKSARIAIGATGPAPVRASSIEAELVGKTLDAGTLAQAADLALTLVNPVTTVRGSAEYLREMTVVMVRRALLEAARQAGCTV